jgi:hypothetical protein
LSYHLLPKILNINIKTIILPVLFYGYGTSSLTLRKEHRLRAFKNRVLRRIFGYKREEVAGDWRRLRNEEAWHGEACSMRGINEKCIQNFGRKT